MAAFADTEAARLSVYCIEAHWMRFTVVATGQSSPGRAFGFGLTASSLTRLSVVNSPIRPAGLAPAWHPASPAHTRIPKLTVRNPVGTARCAVPARAGAGGTHRAMYDARQHSFRRLTLRSATGTAQRAIPTSFGIRAIHERKPCQPKLKFLDQCREVMRFTP